MATLTTRFNVGDTVYLAECEMTSTPVQCPDCLGTRSWKAILPSGEEVPIECPSCRSGYCSIGRINRYGARAEVRPLTIGSVAYDHEGPRYMCEETGVCSGRVYHEEHLCATQEEAEIKLPAMKAEKEKAAAEYELKQYLAKKGDGVGNMTAYYRKEIRDAKKKLEAAQKQLDRIKGVTP